MYQHGIKNSARKYAYSTQCVSCLLELHTRPRLISHLAYSSKKCLELTKLSFPPLADDEVRSLDLSDALSKQKARHKGESMYYAHTPAVTAQGPRTQPVALLLDHEGAMQFQTLDSAGVVWGPQVYPKRTHDLVPGSSVPDHPVDDWTCALCNGSANVRIAQGSVLQSSSVQLSRAMKPFGVRAVTKRSLQGHAQSVSPTQSLTGAVQASSRLCVSSVSIESCTSGEERDVKIDSPSDKQRIGSCFNAASAQCEVKCPITCQCNCGCRRPDHAGLKCGECGRIICVDCTCAGGFATCHLCGPVRTDIDTAGATVCSSSAFHSRASTDTSSSIVGGNPKRVPLLHDSSHVHQALSGHTSACALFDDQSGSDLQDTAFFPLDYCSLPKHVPVHHDSSHVQQASSSRVSACANDNDQLGGVILDTATLPSDYDSLPKHVPVHHDSSLVQPASSCPVTALDPVRDTQLSAKHGLEPRDLSSAGTGIGLTVNALIDPYLSAKVVSTLTAAQNNQRTGSTGDAALENLPCGNQKGGYIDLCASSSAYDGVQCMDHASLVPLHPHSEAPFIAVVDHVSADLVPSVSSLVSCHDGTSANDGVHHMGQSRLAPLHPYSEAHCLDSFDHVMCGTSASDGVHHMDQPMLAPLHPYSEAHLLESFDHVMCVDQPFVNSGADDDLRCHVCCSKELPFASDCHTSANRSPSFSPHAPAGSEHQSDQIKVGIAHVSRGLGRLEGGGMLEFLRQKIINRV